MDRELTRIEAVRRDVQVTLEGFLGKPVMLDPFGAIRPDELMRIAYHLAEVVQRYYENCPSLRAVEVERGSIVIVDLGGRCLDDVLFDLEQWCDAKRR